MTHLEGTERQRAEAALDVMREAGSVGDRATCTSLRQLEGGWSRHSYILSVEDPDQADARSGRDFVVRVRPPGPLLDTDLGQEFRIYALLADEPVPTPRVHGMESSETTAFGGPFFVMDRVPGSAPNVWRRGDRTALEADWEDGRGIAEQLVANLAAIHSVHAGRLDGAMEQRGFRASVEHWRGIQEEMRLVRDPIVEEAYAWVLDREPATVEPCLVHSDYRIGNCLIDDGRISGVLDWELSHVGDPRFDLGYLALEYHAGKFAKSGSRLLNAVAEREWFFDRYVALSGRDADREAVRTFGALGALMLIAILTTGVRMYSDGATSDIRMAWNRFAIPGLRQDVAALMEW